MPMICGSWGHQCLPHNVSSRNQGVQCDKLYRHCPSKKPPQIPSFTTASNLIKRPRHWPALTAAQHHRYYPASCLCLYSDRPHTVSFLCSNMIGAGYSKPNFSPRAILLRYIRYCTYQERCKTYGARVWASGRGHGILLADKYRSRPLSPPSLTA